MAELIAVRVHSTGCDERPRAAVTVHWEGHDLDLQVHDVPAVQVEEETELKQSKIVALYEEAVEYYIGTEDHKIYLPILFTKSN